MEFLQFVQTVITFEEYNPYKFYDESMDYFFRNCSKPLLKYPANLVDKWRLIIEELKKFDDFKFCYNMFTRDYESILDLFFSTFYVIPHQKFPSKNFFDLFEEIYDLTEIPLLNRNKDIIPISFVHLIQIGKPEVFDRIVKKCEKEFDDLSQTNDMWLPKYLMSMEVDERTWKFIDSKFKMEFNDEELLKTFIMSNSATSKSIETWKLIFSKFKNINMDKFNLLAYAQHIEMLEIYCEHFGLPSASNNHQFNAFTIITTMSYSTKTIDLIINQGLVHDVDPIDCYGTGLELLMFFGIKMKNLKIVEDFFEKGVEPDVNRYLKAIQKSKFDPIVSLNYLKLMLKFKPDFDKIDLKKFHEETRNHENVTYSSNIIALLEKHGFPTYIEEKNVQRGSSCTIN
eukprot:gene11760-5098_t